MAVPLPVEYDDRRDTWRVQGAFCSFSCAKAYNFDGGGGYRSSIRGQLLTLLKKRMTNTLSGVVPAPPRCQLSVFGGHLSIDEFRRTSDATIISLLPPRMISVELIAHERQLASRRAKPQPPNPEDGVSFEGSTVKNEPLRLKRPRPMPSDTNTLARTMGLTVS